MTTAALGAARRLSVDVANLSFRLALAESTQEEVRQALFFEAPGGAPQKRIDPDLWQRRMAYAHGQDDEPTRSEVVLTEEQAATVIQVLNALEQLL